MYNVVFNSEELIGTTEYLTLCTKCRIKRYRNNRGFYNSHNEQHLLVVMARETLCFLWGRNWIVKY